MLRFTSERPKRKLSIKSMLNNFVDSCILVQCQISNGLQIKQTKTSIVQKIKAVEQKKISKRTVLFGFGLSKIELIRMKIVIHI